MSKLLTSKSTYSPLTDYNTYSRISDSVRDLKKITSRAKETATKGYMNLTTKYPGVYDAGMKLLGLK